MSLPLMPKATAVWLIENTALTFDQIGKFCGLHSLEIEALAECDTKRCSIVGLSPITNGQLSMDEIKRCEADPDAELNMLESVLPKTAKKSKHYTPMAKRQDKPNAVAWFLKFHPEVPDAAVRKLLGTTMKTIESIRNKTHVNIDTIKPSNPVLLGVCSDREFEKVLAEYKTSEDNAE
ncbi:MAG: DUF1013 domain-containing protein [Alphaproteobacteria bacterium]|nr:DUF1013 domain-containing protein [Alphaproteobacteria bacterium]